MDKKYVFLATKIIYLRYTERERKSAFAAHESIIYRCIFEKEEDAIKYAEENTNLMYDSEGWVMHNSTNVIIDKFEVR